LQGEKVDAAVGQQAKAVDDCDDPNDKVEFVPLELSVLLLLFSFIYIKCGTRGSVQISEHHFKSKEQCLRIVAIVPHSFFPSRSYFCKLLTDHEAHECGEWARKASRLSL
jgi:hypothetical protein